MNTLGSESRIGYHPPPNGTPESWSETVARTQYYIDEAHRQRSEAFSALVRQLGAWLKNLFSGSRAPAGKDLGGLRLRGSH